MNIKTAGKKRKNRKIKEPLGRRAKRSIIKVSKVLAVTAIAASAFFGGRWIYKEVLTTPYLSVHTVNVSGLEKVTKEEALELTGIEDGRNIFSFNKKDVIAGLKKNPWVEDVAVSRSLPDTVNIEVRERQALALVRLDDLYVMDSSGTVFKKYTHEDDLDLPVVTGLTMEGLKGDAKGLDENLLELIRTLKDRRGFNLAQISEIHIDPTFGLSVYTLDEGVRLDVGKGSFEEKFEAFEKVLRARDGVLRNIQAMDLNNSREVVVSFTTQVVKEGNKHGQKG